MVKVTKNPNSLPHPSSWPAQYVHSSTDEQNQVTATNVEKTAPTSASTPKVTSTQQTEVNVAKSEPTPTTGPREVGSVSRRLAERQAATTAAVQSAQQNYDGVRSAFEQHHDDYITGRRNPVSDLITKPQRDEAKERRLKQASIISLISDTLGLIGKGYAVSQGVMPTVTEGVASNRSMAELQRLDDVYREEGSRYDQQNIMDALRRNEAADRMQQYRLGLAHDELRDARAKDTAAQNMILSQELSAEERAYAERIRKEDNARSDKRFSQQLAASAAGRSGRNDDYSYKHIAMMAHNPATGERVPIYDGQFSMLLNDAIRKNPKLQSELESAQGSSQAAFDSKRKQIASAEYSAQIKSGEIKTTSTDNLNEIVKSDANRLKQNGTTEVAINDLRVALGEDVVGVSDDQLIKAYKTCGVEVTK